MSDLGYGSKPQGSSAATILTAAAAVGVRLRESDVFLVVLAPDGGVACSDRRASGFFKRYVLPQVQFAETDQCSFGALALERLSAEDAEIVAIDTMPGVIAVVGSFETRDHEQVAFCLFARAKDFSVSDDIARACSSLSLDGTWIEQQAEQLRPASTCELKTVARLVPGMFEDQIEKAQGRGEVDTMAAQLSDTYEELSLIYQLSRGMRINRAPGDFFAQACADVREVMQVGGVGVVLDGARGQPRAVHGLINVDPESIDRLANELSLQTHLTTKPVLINDVASHEQLGWFANQAQQLLSVPLQRQDETLGLMIAINKHDGEFNTVDSKLLTSIANEAAIFLENASLFGEVRDLMMGLMHSLVSAVDAKDTYTCGHSERVALTSRMLAERAGLEAVTVDRIYISGLLHDVGKIGVSETVLQKAGRLTPEEFDQMKKHPEIGARILRDIRQIEDILPGVLHHHERYDGRGYPHGLAGEMIPLMGRIICLADSFDAMTSNRTYRNALPLEVALAEIRRCAGTQFDPRLTDAFLSIDIDAFREVMGEHRRLSTDRIRMAHVA